jgi:hypothetical protein
VYCHTLIDRFVTSIFRDPAGILALDLRQFVAGRPDHDLVLGGDTLNSDTLSAAEAGMIKTLSMMRQAAPRPSSRRLEICGI